MRTTWLVALALLTLALGCQLPTDGSPADTARAPLVVASDLDNMPFAGVDELGRPVGRDVEMMEALAEALGREIEWKRRPFETLLPAAQGGYVDVVCATLGITPERAEKVSFTRPYFETVIQVVVRAGDGEPRSWQDLVGRKVAAGRDTTSERALITTLPSTQAVLENKSGLNAAERLLVGEVDGVVMDGPNAAELVRSSEGALALLEPPLATERYGLALPLGAETLRAALDRALEAMRRDGSLEALNRRWGLTR